MADKLAAAFHGASLTDTLRPILTAYRQEVQPHWSPATAHPDFDGKQGDPAGQCGVTSAWLQRRLWEDHGIDAAYCGGELFYRTLDAPGQSHWWLELGRFNYADRVVIDLTADQITGLEAHQVVCSSHIVISLHHWLYYATSCRFTAQQLLADPVQARLAILTAAVGR